MNQLHGKLEIFSFEVNELQTKNAFLIGFECCEFDGQERFEITLCLLGNDGEDENDEGVSFSTFYLPPDTNYTFDAIFNNPASSKELRELFSDLNELNELERALVPKINDVILGNIKITEWDNEEMLRTIEAETDIDLSELCEIDVLSPLWIYIN